MLLDDAEVFGAAVAGIGPRVLVAPDWRTLTLYHDRAEDLVDSLCTQFDAAEQAAIAKMRAQGVKEITFDAAGDKVVDAAFERSSQRWAKSLDERGKPGSATLAAMRKAVAEVK